MINYFTLENQNAQRTKLNQSGRSTSRFSRSFSGPINEQWLDARRFTNTIRFGAVDSTVSGQAFLSLLDFHSWRRLSVIFDAQNGDRRGLNIRTQQECMPVVGLLRQRAARYNVLQVDTDSNNPNVSLSTSLRTAKAHSRSELRNRSQYIFMTVDLSVAANQ